MRFKDCHKRMPPCQLALLLCRHAKYPTTFTHGTCGYAHRGWAGHTISARVSFSRDECVRETANRTIASVILARLVAADARIVILLTSPDCSRSVFAESWRSNRLQGTGHSWLLAWISNSIFLQQSDHGAAIVDLDAVRGAEGILGVRAFVERDTSTHSQYIRLWERVSHPRACSGGDALIDGQRYCRPTSTATLSGYAAYFADCVFLVAHAAELASPDVIADPDRFYEQYIKSGARDYSPPAGGLS